MKEKRYDFLGLGLLILIISAPLSAFILYLGWLLAIIIALKRSITILVHQYHNPNFSLGRIIKKLFHSDPLNLPHLTLIIMAIITTLTSRYHLESAGGLAILLSYLTTYYLMISWIKEQRQIKSVLITVAISAAVVSLLGFSLFAFRDTFTKTYSLLKIPVDPQRAVGTFGNPNFYAAYLILFFPFIFASGFVPSSPTRRLSWVLLSFLMIINLILSGSRTAWLSFIVELSIFLFLALSYHSRFKNLIPGLCLLSLGMLTCLIFFLQSQRWLTFFHLPQDRSLITRIRLWETTLRIIRDHPWSGTGLGTFHRIIQEYLPKSPEDWHSHAHNLYLHLGGEMGVPGLMAFIWFLTLVFRQIRQIYLNIRNSKFRLLIIGGIAGVGGFLTHTITEVLINNTQFGIMFWILLAIIFSFGKIVGKKCNLNSEIDRYRNRE